MAIKATSWNMVPGKPWETIIVKTETPVAVVRGWGIYEIEYATEGIRYSIIDIKKASHIWIHCLQISMCTNF